MSNVDGPPPGYHFIGQAKCRCIKLWMDGGGNYWCCKGNLVDHPPHYGGADNLYEAIKVIEAWGLGFCLGNALKYISRAGKKDDAIQDLRKAAWYLNREIERRSDGKED
jgi:hypothetical protein